MIPNRRRLAKAATLERGRDEADVERRRQFAELVEVVFSRATEGDDAMARATMADVIKAVRELKLKVGV